MPPIIKAIILGVLQGATEFLPVSSSGHLTLFPWLLDWADPSLLFDTLVHLATLLAVVVYFRERLVGLVRAWWLATFRGQKSADGRLAWLIVLATLPGALMGYFLDSFFMRLFASPAAVAAFLLVTGLVLYAGERSAQRRKQLGEISAADALFIGLCQGLAIAPGISRSGATITAGRFRGLDRNEAASFSFIAAIPLIAGAAGMQVIETLVAGPGSTDIAFLVAGCAAALVSGYLAIRLLLRYVREHSLLPFAYYCWAVGIVGLVVYWVR